MSTKLLKQLAKCNLKAAAFDMAKGLGGGVYKNDMAAALDLFTKLPCPETAINLVAVCPESLALMTAASDTFVRMTPQEYRGPKLRGLRNGWNRLTPISKRQAPFRRSFIGRQTAAVSE